MKPPSVTWGYRELATLLWDLLETRQFIWCSTIEMPETRVQEVDDPVIAWKLDSQQVKVIAYIDAWLWDAMVNGEEENWKNPVLATPPDQGGKGTSALVEVPIPAACAIRLGPLKPWLTVQREERLRQRQLESSHG